MQTKNEIRVLSVGQCSFDGRAIETLLHSIRSCIIVEHVGAADQAIKQMQARRYALILVNRILDATGESGFDLIRSIRNVPQSPPVMLVSNLADAQEESVALGAIRGFGKSRLGSEEVRELLNLVLKNEDC